MSIAFLYPLMWLAGAAVGVPIWLHLRRRPDRNVVRFSALRFLPDQPLVRRNPLRLDDLPLLLLRLLALLLLIAAFAWPYRPHDASGMPTESRVYLLDNTLSHQADEGFSRARDRLVKEVAEADLGTQIAVVEVRAHPRAVVGFGDTREAAAEALRSLKPSSERGSYAAALRQAHALLTKTLGEGKSIVVCSDNQENQWAEVLETPPFLKGIEVVLPDTGEATRPNPALARPQVQRTFAGDKAIVDLSVEFHHQGKAKSVDVVMQANGRRIVDTRVDLTGQPESTVMSARWETDPVAAVTGEVSVSGKPDALPGDNRVFFSLPPVQEGTVLLLAGSPFLRVALSRDVMQGFWATRLLEPPQAAVEANADQLADVVCVESGYLRSEDVRDLVQRYVDDGRGVLLVLDQDTPVAASFLRRLGLEVESGGRAESETTRLGYVFTDHPIFRPFRSPDFGNLTDVKVFRHRRLSAGQTVPLILSDRGDPLLLQATTTKGKLFVCSFGFDRESTNWPVHPTFLPFLDLCLQNARGQRGMTTAFEPGQTCVLDAPRSASGKEFVLRDGDRELRRGTVKNGRAEFPSPPVPGLYTVAFGSDPSTHVTFSVNPPHLESDLTYLTSLRSVRSWTGDASAERRQLRPATTPLALSRSEILRQRIWWMLLVGGLAALLVEAVWLLGRGE